MSQSNKHGRYCCDFCGAALQGGECPFCSVYDAVMGTQDPAVSEVSQ